MSKSFYFHSLGCKVNSYENAAMKVALSNLGYTEAATVEEASLLIINTCSVTSVADKKSRQHIASFRQRNPRAILVAMGCYSQSNAKTCLEKGADIVLGTGRRSALLDCLKRYETGERGIIELAPNIRLASYEELGVNAFSENARAYLKIQDGCDNFCSYCAIPFLRGKSRSRQKEEVIAEAVSLWKHGYQEIIVTGIHIGAYGKDLGDGSYRLSALLKDILEACPTLFRLRISSLEESEIDDAFLDLLAKYPNLVSHLHLPLQSGSSSVLKRMKRPYDTEAFLTTLGRIRSVRPDIAITTDVIAGFPEESEAEWAETMEFCQKARFAEIHVFPYSSRPLTVAARLPQVDPATKKERVHQLLELSKKLREEYEQRFYGREMDVLLEDYDEEKGVCRGHTSNYLLVSVPSSRPRSGEIVRVKYDSKTASD